MEKSEKTDKQQPGTKSYEGKQVTVSFEAARCLHAAECARGLPGVFDPVARRTVRTDPRAGDRVAEVVRRCPSGALQYRLTDGTVEEPACPTEITRSADGGLVVRGDLLVHGATGAARHETRAVLCGCSLSANQPYCDHSGPCAGGGAGH
jgi:uncharacterized Fe-S cluster protein YjdI